MGILELGHTGLHCDDVTTMRDFYERVLGLTVTDEDPGLGLVFLSSRPEFEHHEMVLAPGRNVPPGARLVNQISWRVDGVEALQIYHRALLDYGSRIEAVVTHGNAIGIYFQDPEANKLEVYWQTGLDVSQPFRKTISLDGSVKDVLAENKRLVEEGGPSF
ncbi:VOC family protein [Streptomyces sp. NPDC058221]|uniref:VOC family protein n=1 Tax=Streptomyces sp. NPDC058221 TaxID=3346388 RepID=UPI0036E5CACC